jgi:hypothetical protein
MTVGLFLLAMMVVMARSQVKNNVDFVDSSWN